MTASEDQPELIVLDRLVVEHVGLLLFLELHGEILQRGVAAYLAADFVDRPEAAGRDQPGERVLRTAVARPLRRSRREGIGHRLLCAFEIAEQADERRQHPAGVAAIDGIEPLADRGIRAQAAPPS